MRDSALYLSRPAVVLPELRLDNAAVIQRVKANFRGAPGVWNAIEAGIRYVFSRCGSRERYFAPLEDSAVGALAARSAEACLEQCGVAAGAVDLVINGSVAREYYEPATAMEVAGRLGLERVHAFDVTSACVGQLQGVQVAAALFSLYPRYRHALVVAGELSTTHLCYDIQCVDELAYKAAGLTIGNAAACWLLSREPQPGGCVRLEGQAHVSLPQHWRLCQAPISGVFTSYTQKLFALNVHVAPELRRAIEERGWQVEEVAHFFMHQPSDQMNAAVLGALGVELERVYLGTHDLYGNTVSTSVALNMHEVLRRRTFAPGDKLVFGSAAAGFSLSALLGTWQDS